MYDLLFGIIIIFFIFAIVVLYYVLKIHRAQKEIKILEEEIDLGRKERDRINKLKNDVKIR